MNLPTWLAWTLGIAVGVPAGIVVVLGVLFIMALPRRT